MKSVFENVPDKIIFKLVKMVMEEVDFESLETSQSSELSDELKSISSSYFGVQGDDFTIDSDYIYNLWQLNSDLFDEEKLTSPLNRPKHKKVSFDWYVYETHFVKSTYEHEVETYGLTKEDISDYINALNYEGNLNYYDGNEVESDIYESETTDDSIDDSSFTII